MGANKPISRKNKTYQQKGDRGAVARRSGAYATPSRRLPVIRARHPQCLPPTA
jgi:hypothetical protein